MAFKNMTGCAPDSLAENFIKCKGVHNSQRITIYSFLSRSNSLVLIETITISEKNTFYKPILRLLSISLPSMRAHAKLSNLNLSENIWFWGFQLVCSS